MNLNSQVTIYKYRKANTMSTFKNITEKEGVDQHLQSTLSFTFAFSRLDKHPETSIVLVVDVACKVQTQRIEKIVTINTGFYKHVTIGNSSVSQHETQASLQCWQKQHQCAYRFKAIEFQKHLSKAVKSVKTTHNQLVSMPGNLVESRLMDSIQPFHQKPDNISTLSGGRMLSNSSHTLR